MKISFTAPFGNASQESGMMMLLGCFLKSQGCQISHLVCNGAFKCCDRDAENSWQRKISQCSLCQHEQERISIAAGFDRLELGAFVTPEEARDTARALIDLPQSELSNLGIAGFSFLPLAEHSIRRRLGTSELNVNNIAHNQMLRAHYLGVWQTLLATRRFQNNIRPDLLLVAGGDDYITRSIIAQSRTMGRLVSLFSWRISDRAVHVAHPTRGEIFSTEFIVADPVTFRTDTKTWPTELIELATKLSAFLDLPLNDNKRAVG